MAASINGIIARDNGSEDFLSDVNWSTFVQLAEKKGCFVIGRKTYEKYKNNKVHSFEKIQAKKIVVSQSKLKVSENWYLVRSVKEVLLITQSFGKKEIILTGGASLNSSFAKAKVLKEVILNLNPVIVGKGKSIFDPKVFNLKLDLLKIKKLEGGIVQLCYKVK